eukprot:446146-Pyramimonas_sp.AAC.1
MDKLMRSHVGSAALGEGWRRLGKVGEGERAFCVLLGPQVGHLADDLVVLVPQLLHPRLRSCVVARALWGQSRGLREAVGEQRLAYLVGANAVASVPRTRHRHARARPGSSPSPEHAALPIAQGKGGAICQ